MDKQVIKEHVEDMIKAMKLAIEYGDPFTLAAQVLGTVTVEGKLLEEPAIISLTPECHDPPLTPRQFDSLVAQMAGESKAVALVVGDYHERNIDVELAGERYALALVGKDQWRRHDLSLHPAVITLNCNRYN